LRQRIAALQILAGTDAQLFEFEAERRQRIKAAHGFTHYLGSNAVPGKQRNAECFHEEQRSMVQPFSPTAQGACSNCTVVWRMPKR
jgi:hypothetical protein